MRNSGLDVTRIRPLWTFVASLGFLSELFRVFFGNTGLSYCPQRKLTSENFAEHCHPWRGTCMSSSRSSGTPEGEDITSVAAHRILSHYEFGSSRVNTALAIVIVLGNDILLLMLV